MSVNPLINKSLTEQLQVFLTGTEERVGFVLDTGEIVECVNICDDPENGFDVRDADMIAYCDRAIATWHTHPDGTKLLSVGDHETFRTSDDLVHLIVAPDGVAAYKVVDDMVLNHTVTE